MDVDALLLREETYWLEIIARDEVEDGVLQAPEGFIAENSVKLRRAIVDTLLGADPGTAAIALLQDGSPDAFALFSKWWNSVLEEGNACTEWRPCEVLPGIWGLDVTLGYRLKKNTASPPPPTLDDVTHLTARERTSRFLIHQHEDFLRCCRKACVDALSERWSDVLEDYYESKESRTSFAHFCVFVMPDAAMTAQLHHLFE